MDGNASAHGYLTQRDWLLLAATIPIIAVLSLGAHDLAIAHLGIPYPNSSPPVWVNVVGQAVRIGAAVLLYRGAERFFRSRSLLSAALTIGFLLVFLQETLRVIIVEIFLEDGWVDHRWVYVLLSHFPAAALSLIQGCLAVLIGRFCALHKPVLPLLLVCGAGALAALAISPALQAVPPALFARFTMVAPEELYQMPYDWYIYRVIYTTFWIQLPYPMALLSFGQFFVETLILAGLTGLVWARIQRRIIPMSAPASVG